MAGVGLLRRICCKNHKIHNHHASLLSYTAHYDISPRQHVIALPFWGYSLVSVLLHTSVFCWSAWFPARAERYQSRLELIIFLKKTLKLSKIPTVQPVSCWKNLLRQHPAAPHGLETLAVALNTNCFFTVLPHSRKIKDNWTNVKVVNQSYKWIFSQMVHRSRHLDVFIRNVCVHLHKDVSTAEMSLLSPESCLWSPMQRSFFLPGERTFSSYLPERLFFPGLRVWKVSQSMTRL